MSEREEKSCMEQTDPSGGAPTKAADVPGEARAEEERLKAEYADIQDSAEDTNAENVSDEGLEDDD